MTICLSARTFETHFIRST